MHVSLTHPKEFLREGTTSVVPYSLPKFWPSGSEVSEARVPLIQTTLSSSLYLLLFLLFLACTPLHAQQSSPPKQSPPPPPPSPRITIEVTGGDANVPIENASVYLKTEEDHFIKDKKTEINIKTNMHGIAHVSDAPLGRVLIQIVAEGWKTYGHWYDITDPKQVLKIHLDRPPKWY
jgi:hypothetical protein